MARFEVTTPDGRRLEITAPDGATEADAIEYAKNLPAKAEAPKVEAPKPDLLHQMGRQAGLTVRAGVQGLTAIPNMVGDALGLESSKSVSSALTGLGLPEPETATERVSQDVSGAMAGGGGIVQLGKGLAKAATPVVQKIGGMFSAAPGLQTVSNAGGAGAAGATREAGGSETSQLIASLVGSMAPSLTPAATQSMVRGGIRGGEQGRVVLNDNLRLLMDTKTPPTVGLATGNRRMQAMESLLAKAPGGAGPMAKAGEDIADAMGNRVGGIADDLATNADPNRAGLAIEGGIKGFVKRFKDTQSSLYDKLDNFLPLTSRVSVDRTRAALTELDSEIAGSPALSEWFKNARISGMRGGLESDVTGLEAQLTRPGMREWADELRGKLTKDAEAVASKNSQRKILGLTDVDPVPTAAQIDDQVRQQVMAQADGRLPYEALKKLRSLVGEELSNNSLVATVPRSKWKALYAAISEDMGTAAKGAGPEAERAFARANQHTHAGFGRIEELDRVIGRTAEQTYKTLTSDPSNASKIGMTLKSLTPDERDMVKATFISRMGKATAGKQDETGDLFSSETFLTNWNKLDPRSKAVLFSGKDGQLREDLDKIASVSAKLREGSKVLANPSGTGGAVANMGAGTAAVASLFTGNFPAFGLIVGGMAGLNVGARVMTHAPFVKWLASTTNAPLSAMPTLINSLAQVRDEAGDSALASEIDAVISAVRR